MSVNLPKPDELNINSLEESVEIIRLLLLKIKEIEEWANRDRGLVEEIIHLRQETRVGFSAVDKRFEKLEDKVDENTLAVKSLQTVMKGGFDNGVRYYKRFQINWINDSPQSFQVITYHRVRDKNLINSICYGPFIS